MKLFIFYCLWIGLTVYRTDGQPSSRNRDEWYKEQWPTQPYAFGYEIRDYSGNEQYRKEMSDGDRVTGSYGYLGPDGLYRHVEYIADENGFRAKIRTSEPGTSNDNPSNVEIQSNPIRVLGNPSAVNSPGVNTGSDYGVRNPSAGGYRRDEVRPPPDRSGVTPNPNRSTYSNQTPNGLPLPQIPNPSRGSDKPSERDRIDINRGPDVSRPLSPDYIDPNLQISPIGPTRGGPDGKLGVTFDDIPDNVVPYKGSKPGPPYSAQERPGDISTPKAPENQNIKPYFGRSPEYTRNELPNRLTPPPPPPPLPTPISPTAQPYDRKGSPNSDPNYDDRRGPSIRDPGYDDRRGPSMRDPGYDNRRGPSSRDPDYDDRKGYPSRDPAYDRRGPPTREPAYEDRKGYPNKGPAYEDRRGPPIRGPTHDDRRGQRFGVSDGRGYEVTPNIGSTKGPQRDQGFIEATKGPTPPTRPLTKFYDKKPMALYEYDGEDYDRFSRRQDDDKSVVNKPVFENRDTTQAIDGQQPHSRHNITNPIVRDGVKTGLTPAFRDSLNRTLNESTYDANQGRRDDTRVRRPTKVFVTSGPISGFADTRPDIKGTDRLFGSIDAQQPQQHIDIDYDDKNIRDGQQIDSNGIRGQRDRDRLQPPKPVKGTEQPPDVRPYYGSRREGHDRSEEPLPPTRQQDSRQPAPPYDPRLEQHHVQAHEDTPVPPDDEYPVDQQTERPLRPQVFQPLRPNQRPDRQPSRPQRPDNRPYKPRTQPQDRSYEEQQHIEIQPYQTQSSATISSPVNTVPNAYKPIDELEEDNEKANENDSKDKPSLNTPFSPSAYIITPFPAPVNETKTQIKPTLEYRPEAPTFTAVPELTQMEVPKFGTRLRPPDPPTQNSYQPIDYDEGKDDSQKGLDENNYENDYQNQNISPNDKQNAKPTDNPIASPLVMDNYNDNYDKDQYYSYYDDNINEQSDPTHDVESKDNPKSLIYSHSMSKRSDEKLDITSNTNQSLPIEITHKVMKAINWHKFDTIDDSDRQTVLKPVVMNR